MPIRLKLIPFSLFAALAAMPALRANAGEYVVTPVVRTEFKAVFGKVESRDVVPARARLGGTIISLEVEEGSAVNAGDVIAVVVDDKLALQLDAVDARLEALSSEIKNADIELARARKLLAGGVASKASVDALKLQSDVLGNRLAATQAERAVLVQQGAEGEVLAPAPGRVLSVPVTKGSVIMPGETVARIAGGGYFLRLSLPERHAATLRKGDSVRVGPRGINMENTNGEKLRTGTLVKVYPEIDAGRVLADVEVDGLGDFFAGERTLVWIPVSQRNVLSVPTSAITNAHGIDYVKVIAAKGPIDVAVIIGEAIGGETSDQTEILTGLMAGDKVLTP